MAEPNPDRQFGAPVEVARPEWRHPDGCGPLVPCGCAAYDPVHNDHTAAEHISCGSSAEPCGGCDSCLSAQAGYWRQRRAATDG